MKIAANDDTRLQYIGKKTYKKISKLYKEEHNTAMSRLHYTKFLKNEKQFGESLDKYEEAAKNQGFIPEIKAFGVMAKNAAKMFKEKLLSAYYYSKSR